ncbi:MAG: sodium-translocating pyrophosphatase [Clostridia bacterium]
MEYLQYLAPLFGVLALLFAALLATDILKQDKGTPLMQQISLSIKKGANAYLKRQYKGVFIFFIVVFLILLALSFTQYLDIFTPFAFLTGGFFSALSGYIGMKIATASNARCACAAEKSLNKGLKLAFNAGGVMGFVVVGLGLCYVCGWYYFLVVIGKTAEQIGPLMLNFGIGASSMALFARVGGGIFTKAADVGADLVGKVEAGIPEDDPRNPAVIADNVGDNVGDVAGMGADLYESYVGSIVSTAALAVAAGLSSMGIVVPMILAGIGILASIIGSLFVKTKEDASSKSLLFALRKGVFVSAFIVAVLAFLLIKFTLGNLGFYVAILVGLLAGILIGLTTEYYTSDNYKPTKKLSESSKTGPATVIIKGLSLGMMSTLLPVIIIAAGVLISYYVSGGAINFSEGLYGIGLAAVGMLSTLGVTLATDAYGPIADNAGGIAQMANMGEIVRKRTDALDSLGNTTAATGKGFAIGSAALTALTLIAAYLSQIKNIVGEVNFLQYDFAVTNPTVLAGLFIGAVLPFIFAALTMDSVGKAAMSVVFEVRRQFKEIVGIMDRTAEPDYASCVDICTKSAQREMILPAVLAIVVPIITGLLIGVTGVVGMLAGSTATGFILAVMMSNSGGAWDNAKKYIESGELGGKGSEEHKAAIVGDTVGDPFKDTSGPSINILIKLVSMVSIVFVGFILAYTLMK